MTGLIWALLSLQGLANRGEYQSIVLDFREDLATGQLEQELGAIAKTYGIHPTPNSVFSQSDHLYIVNGDAALLKALRRSELRQSTESIAPNYIYHALEVPNDPDYPKQWNFRSINLEGAWDNAKGNGVTVAVIDTGI
ncbi:MAG: peptidase S8, partial [Cyanobacteria bacterium CAN_BIN43]|nr:peptidase S8 [Cyanobacteria bacterium CAN_BIN43]